MLRNYNDKITFTVTSGPGYVVGTGNGNPSDHTDDFSNSRVIWNGLARAIIGTKYSNLKYVKKNY